MDDTNPPNTDQQKTNEDQPREQEGHDGLLVSFGRRHPALTIAGLAAAGLIGGIDMAAGVLLGAGAIALLRRQRRPPEPTGQTPAHPHDLHSLKERARAIAKAAKGEPTPTRPA